MLASLSGLDQFSFKKMITLLIVSLPKRLPTVDQHTAVPPTGPAGISQL